MRVRCTKFSRAQYVNRWYTDCQSSCSTSMSVLKIHCRSNAFSSKEAFRKSSVLTREPTTAKPLLASYARLFEIASPGNDEGKAKMQFFFACVNTQLHILTKRLKTVDCRVSLAVCSNQVDITLIGLQVNSWVEMGRRDAAGMELASLEGMMSSGNYLSWVLFPRSSLSASTGER